MSEPTLYREATRDEIAMDDLGVVSAVDVYTMDVVLVKPDEMWLCWSDKAGTWLRSHHNHNQVCNDRCGDVLIVGIGDTDE